MIAVVIQPSYIPWRGFFDLIHRADTFVFYDDVQFDKHGWRNRNRIKTSAGTQWLTLPVKKKGNVENAVRICDVELDAASRWGKKHLATLSQSYARAPFAERTLSLVRPFYERSYEKLADLTIDLTTAIAKDLGITRTRFIRSSTLALTGAKNERLIQLLREVGATHYISGPSARDYIDAEAFARASITLEYAKYEYPEYEQLHPPFDPFVSVLDLLFMKGPESSSYIWGSAA
jgi:hypothetical protein